LGEPDRLAPTALKSLRVRHGGIALTAPSKSVIALTLR
jgi:hypothetical protein